MTLVIFIRAEEHHGIVASFNKKTGDPDQVLPIHFFHAERGLLLGIWTCN